MSEQTYASYDDLVAEIARLRAILEKQDAAILAHDALKAEVERLTREREAIQADARQGTG